MIAAERAVPASARTSVTATTPGWGGSPFIVGTVVTPSDFTAAMRRCDHRQRGRKPVMVCAICGGQPGPRVVTARAEGIGNVAPEMSARHTLNRSQRLTILSGAVILALLVLLAPVQVATSLIALATLLYVAILVQRVRTLRAVDGPPGDGHRDRGRGARHP